MRNNRFIYADPNKCIGCINCELACSASHMGLDIDTVYEMALNGEIIAPSRNKVIKVDGKTAPMQCMQCLDAPCLEACPVDIIKFEDGYVKYYEDDCIGCQSCDMVCPYGAVVMAVNTKPDAPISQMVALTCDLCGGENGKQACINICPTDAIRLIDYEQFKQIQTMKS
jgi:carbon-monoxide dehydrogenase iron sulfur subunit